MCVNVKKYNGILVAPNVNRPPVSGNVDAPLALSIASQRVIIQNRAERTLFKNKKPFIKLTAYICRRLFIALFEPSVEVDSHYELR